MCAIVGVHTDKPNACLTLYNAMTVLQHEFEWRAGVPDRSLAGHSLKESSFSW